MLPSVYVVEPLKFDLFALVLVSYGLNLLAMPVEVVTSQSKIPSVLNSLR